MSRKKGLAGELWPNHVRLCPIGDSCSIGHAQLDSLDTDRALGYAPAIRGMSLRMREVANLISSGSGLIYVTARLPGQLAFGFSALASGKAAFLVNSMPVFIGLVAFNVNPLPAD